MKERSRNVCREFFFAYFLVPETKGRTLEEIEADSRGTQVASSRVR